MRNREPHSILIETFFGHGRLPTHKHCVSVKKRLEHGYKAAGVWLLVLGALGAFATLFLVAPRTPVDSAQVLEAEQIRRAYRGIRLLERAMVELATERGLVYVALNAPLTTSATAITEIDRHRRTGAAALSTGLGQLQRTLRLPGSWPSMSLQVELEGLERLRERVDADLWIPRERRSVYVRELWFRETTRIIEALETLHAATHLRLARANPALRTPLALERQVLRIAERAGQARARMSAGVARDEPFTPGERLRLEASRTQVEREWQRLEQLDHRAPAHVALEMREVQRRLFGALDAQQRALAEPKAQTGQVPRSASDWFTLSTEAIEALLDLGRRAGQRAIEDATGSPPGQPS